MKTSLFFIVIITLFTGLNAQEANNYPYRSTSFQSLLNNPSLQNMDGKELLNYLMAMEEDVLEEYALGLKNSCTEFTNYQLVNKVNEAANVKIDSMISYYSSSENELIRDKKWSLTHIDENTFEMRLYEWNTDLNTWEIEFLNSKAIISYDVTENWVQEETYWFSESPDEIFGIFKFKMVFDEQNRLSSYFMSAGSEGFDQWPEGSKIEYQYTDFGARDGRVSFNFDDLTKEWIPISYETYNYNDNQQLLSQITYEYTEMNNDEFTITRRIEYDYNEDGSYWKNDVRLDEDTNVLKPFNREFYEADNEEISVYIDFNRNGNEWIPYRKYESVYFEKPKNSESITYNWSPSDSSWIPHEKDEFLFSEHGDLELSLSFSWNSFLNDWEYSRKAEITYLSKYPRSEVQTFQYSFDLGFLLVPLVYDLGAPIKAIVSYYPEKEMQFYNFNTTTNEWELDESRKHFYTEEIITPPSGLIVIAYPNPASEYVIFQADEKYEALIEIHDVNGRLVASQTLKTNEHFPVNQLTNGVYFYKLTLCDDPTKVYNGELVVQFISP